MALRCSALVLLVVSASLAQEPKAPSADELWQKIEPIVLPDPAIRSLDLEGWSGPGKSLRWRLLYKAPARYALYLWAPDGVPVAAVVDRKLVAAETYTGQVLYAHDVGLALTIGVSGEDFWFGYNFFHRGEERRRNSVRLDLASLKELCEPAKVEAQGDARYRLSAYSKKGNRLGAQFDLGSRWSLEKIGLYDGESPKPFFAVSKYSVNPQLTDADFAFPDPQVWKERLAADEIDISTEGAALRVVNVTGTALSAHAALKDPSLRPEFEKRMGAAGADWKKIEERHKELSTLLRDALPAAPKSEAPEPPPAKKKPKEEKKPAEKTDDAGAKEQAPAKEDKGTEG